MGKPRLSSPQNCGAFGGAPTVEEHAAELDRRLGDRRWVIASLDDLGQRFDRLRRAGPGVRLSELEQNRGPFGLSWRLSQGAGKQRGRAIGVAKCQGAACRSAQ